MGAPNNENNPVLITQYIGTVSDADDYLIAELPKKFRLKAAKLINQASAAANGTNYVTLTLKAGSTTLGTIDTDSGGGNDSLVADTPFSFGVTEQTIAADTLLKMTYAEGGTGTLTGAVVQLYGYWV